MPQGLFYPWIDIDDDAWLRTSLLYWDSVRTIVPEAIDAPYSTKTGQTLRDAEFLVPLRVHSEMDEIKELTDDVLEYLQSPEGVALLLGGRTAAPQRLHVDKLPPRIRRLTEVHPEKLPYEIRRIFSASTSSRRSGWLQVDEAFADFYMTLLATRLSDRIGASLLTSLPAADRLALAARLDTRISGPMPSELKRAWQRPQEYAAFGRRREVPSVLAQGMLATLAIERIGVSPSTPIKKLLEFRAKHASELARFRASVEELTKSIDRKLSIEALRERVATIHADRVVPALDDLKGALGGVRIKWTGEGMLKVGFLSAAPTSGLVLAGLAAPFALLAGAGISLVAAGLMYNKERRDSLRESPYSYLLAMRRDLV